MKIKTKEQYNKMLKEQGSTKRKSLPLGRKNKTKSGLKKKGITK